MARRAVISAAAPATPSSRTGCDERFGESVERSGLALGDFVPQVDVILTVGEFYDIAAGGEIIFT